MPWPCTFFSTLKALEDVSWNVALGSSLCPTLELNLLPKTLQRLQLDCEDIFCLMSRQNIISNELFPSLKVLRLKGKRLSEENLKQLPQGLVELSVDSLQSTTASRVLFIDLATTIEHLHFTFNVIDLEGAAKLPKSLQVLGANIDLFDVNETISYLGFIPFISFYFWGSPSRRNTDENWISFLKHSPLHQNLGESPKVPEVRFTHSNLDIGKRYKLAFWISERSNFLTKTSLRALSNFDHLSVLHITQTGASIPPKYIKFVPKSSTDLVFGTLSDFPASSDFVTLPNHLKFLEMRVNQKKKCGWKDKDMKALPYFKSSTSIVAPPPFRTSLMMFTRPCLLIWLK